MAGLGQKRKGSEPAQGVRFTPESGHGADMRCRSPRLAGVELRLRLLGPWRPHRISLGERRLVDQITLPISFGLIRELQPRLRHLKQHNFSGALHVGCYVHAVLCSRTVLAGGVLQYAHTNVPFTLCAHWHISIGMGVLFRPAEVGFVVRSKKWRTLGRASRPTPEAWRP